MTALTVYSAFSMPRVPAHKAPSTASPTSVPQHKPFASQRRMHSLAFNPAIDSMDFAGPRRGPFVRPDVPPVSEDSFKHSQARDIESTAEAMFKARPQFRSALEQVSFVTNNKLWDTRENDGTLAQNHRRRLGIFGL